MNQEEQLEKIIKEKVDAYLDFKHQGQLDGSLEDFNSIVGSTEFQEFKSKLLQDLVNMIHKRDEDDETRTLPSRDSPPPEHEGRRSRNPISELGSSFSSSLTQDLDFMYLNQSQLSELTQSLDPRYFDIARRREALRQIVGMPSIETQMCDAWTAQPDTPTAENRQSGDRFRGRSGSRHSSPETTTAYGIRQGLYDALSDEDPELNHLALKFIVKAFSSTAGNVRECHTLLVEFLVEQFTTDKDKIPLLSEGLNINAKGMEKIMRSFYLLREFHKRLPNYWLRYSEKVTGDLMDNCVSLLSAGYSPGMDDSPCDPSRHITPLHFTSLLDPSAQWFSTWMKSAYGSQPMLKRLMSNKQIVSMWATSCISMFIHKAGRPLPSKDPSVYPLCHLEVAYFLHSLNALTTVLCFRETHRSIFPIQISRDTIKQLSDTDRAKLVKFKALSTSTFMKLFMAFIMSLKPRPEETAPMFEELNRCFQRLTSSPVALVSCFELAIDENVSSTSRKSKKHPSPSKQSESDGDQSILNLLLSHIQASLEKIKSTADYVLIFSKALANICSSVEGCDYLAHPRSQKCLQTVLKITSNCLNLLAEEKFCQDSQRAEAINRILVDFCDVCSKTMLKIRTWQNSDEGLRLSTKVLKTLKLSTLIQARKDGLNASIVEAVETALRTYLMALLQTSKGLDLASSLNLIGECIHLLFSRDNIVDSYAFNEVNFLVSQLTTCSGALKALSRTNFVSKRLGDLWRLLEGSTLMISNSSEPLEGDTTPVTSDNTKKYCSNPNDINDDVIQDSFYRLVNLYANHSAVREDLLMNERNFNSAEVKSLFDFIDRAIMLDSSTKLANLCCQEETMSWGLRFLSLLTSSLDNFLLLETKFGIRNMIISAQKRNFHEPEDGESQGMILDEGVIERNRILVKISILGGPNERYLPSRTLCEHSNDPYPYPVLTSLSGGKVTVFGTERPKNLCNRPPCAVGDSNKSPMKQKRQNSPSFVSIIATSSSRSSATAVGASSKSEAHSILSKLPRLQARIKSLNKLLPQEGKEGVEVDSLLDACLRAFHNRKSTHRPENHPSSPSVLLPTSKELAISLLVEYGIRLGLLEASVGNTSHKQSLAQFTTYADHMSREGHEEVKNSVQQFDWFASSIFLLFKGNASRATDFLNRFYGTRIAQYLWLSSHDNGTANSNHYALCHLFETIFAREMTQVFNTFVICGYSPSVIFRLWLRQCFLNYLNWTEIQDFLVLCFVCGAEAIVFFALSVMKHISPNLLNVFNSPNQFLKILEEPIRGYRLVDYLEFIESLMDKYHDEVTATLNLASTPN